MGKVKIKVVMREIFLFFALPGAAFVAVVGFIFASFILDSLIRYLTGNYGSSEWITQLALITDRASFYPYLFIYPIFVLLRIKYREKRGEALLKSGGEIRPPDPDKARRVRRTLIREGIIFLVFLLFGLFPFMGVYQVFGISLTTATQLAMLGFLVTILYVLYIVIRYIIIGIFIGGIIWIVRKLIKK